MDFASQVEKLLRISWLINPNRKIERVSQVEGEGRMKKALVKWKKASGAAGYKIKYSTSKKLNKSVKSKKVTSPARSRNKNDIRKERHL